MYRDLYSAIMCRPLLSAERQGENEEEKVRPGQRPLLTRQNRKTASGGPASVFHLSCRRAKLSGVYTVHHEVCEARPSQLSQSFHTGCRPRAASALATSSGRRSSVRGQIAELRMIVGVAAGLGFREGADVIDRQRDHPVAEPG